MKDHLNLQQPLQKKIENIDDIIIYYRWWNLYHDGHLNTHAIVELMVYKSSIE